MSDNEEMVEETADSGLHEFWLRTLGLEIGKLVMMVPRAGQVGQGVQGQLMEIVISGHTGCPVAIIIRENELMPRVTVPWDAILLITQPPAGSDTKGPSDIDLEDLVNFAEEHDLDVPDDIRAMLDTP